MRRRDLLKATGVGLLPINLQQALAMPAPVGGLDSVEHVVILMQENRSFDHYYGTLRGVRGFSDPVAVKSVFEQSKVLPYEVGDEFMEGTPHDWGSGHEAWNSGAYDKWVSSKGERTMTYLRRRSLPFYYALADAFTLCDQYFCSENGPTNPNRFFLFTGMIGYEPGSTRRAIDNDSWSDPDHAGYTWTTYAERLEKTGRTWGVYQEWDNYGDNSLEYFVSFLAVARKALARTGYVKFQYFYDDLLKADTAKQNKMLTDLAAGLKTLSTSERRLYDRALRRVRPGKLAESFKADVQGGRLPAVSWIVAPYEESEHPTAGPNSGARLVSDVLDGLASNPAVWNKTVVFLNYDENDGFFDHIPPPAPPVNGDQGKSTVSIAEEITLDAPIGLGARVPMMVVSPWSKGGNVCSEVFDHTSVIRFLEKWTGVAEPNITPWRRSVCGDLTSALDFKAVGGYPSLPVPVPTSGPRPTYPTPPSPQSHPQHEPGVRPSRALPYVLEASGRVADDRFWIDFANTGPVGAHFYVHANAFRSDGPWRYTIGAGAKESDYWQAGGGPYDLIVSGPNGFTRRFVGDRNTSRSAVTLRYAPSEDRVHLLMSNNDSAERTFTVTVGNRSGGPWTYTVAPDDSEEDYFTVVDGWYDLTVTSPDLLRRFTGRMENGKHRTSDPVMGSGPLAATVRSKTDKEIRLDLGSTRTVTGLTYRGTGSYELYLATRENRWQPAATGTSAEATSTVRTWPTQARYVRLVARSAGDLTPLGW